MSRLNYKSSLPEKAMKLAASVSAFALGVYLFVYRPDEIILDNYAQEIRSASTNYLKPEQKLALQEFKGEMIKKLDDFIKDGDLVIFHRKSAENLRQDLENLNVTNTSSKNLTIKF